MKTSISYIEYLEKEGYTESSIKSYGYSTDRFLRWASKGRYHLPTFDYKAALGYIAYLKRKQTKPKNINTLLNGVRITNILLMM